MLVYMSLPACEVNFDCRVAAGIRAVRHHRWYCPVQGISGLLRRERHP